MIKSNFLRNQHLIRARYKIEEIDFFDTNWHSRRISQEELKQIDIVLAADVVYNAEITRAFFQVLQYLLINVEHDSCKAGLEVFISLEKRLWTDADGHANAPSYNLFLECIDDLKANHPEIRIQNVPINFPHIYKDFYDRVSNLVLWRIHTR